MALLDLSGIDVDEISDEFINGQGLIPEGTMLECVVVNAENIPGNNFDPSEKIRVTLEVTEKGKYAGYTVNHNLKINSDKDATRNKDTNALLSYDAIGKGGVVKYAQAGKEITDAVLQKSLIGVKVVVTFAEYTSDNGNKGNWIRSFIAAKKPVKQYPEPVQPVAKSDNTEFADDDAEFADDDIPF